MSYSDVQKYIFYKKKYTNSLNFTCTETQKRIPIHYSQWAKNSDMLIAHLLHENADNTLNFYVYKVVQKIMKYVIFSG